VFDALAGFVTVSVPILAGYVLGRSGLLGPGANKQLNLLAVSFLMPVLLFMIMAKATPQTLFSRLAMVSLLAAVAVFAVYALVAGLIWRRGAASVTVGALASGYTNANNIGLPIALHMLGNPALVAPVVLYQTAVFAPVALAILAAGQGRRPADAKRGAAKRHAAEPGTREPGAPAPGAPEPDSAGRSAAGPGAAGPGAAEAAAARPGAGGAARAHGDTRRPPAWRVALGALLNPIVVGSLAGFAVSVTGLELPRLLMDPLDLIGGGAIPVMLIAFGMSLPGRPVLAKGGERRDVLLATGLKLFGMPLAAWLLGRFAFGLDAQGVYAVVTLATLPTAQNVFNYALRYESNAVLARDAVTLTTLGAAPLVFAVAALLG
jgi:predicted permease